MYHNDGVAARFGNAGDLQIYHSGNDSYIKDGGTGNLLITSDGASVQINKGTTENMAEFIVDGPVRLYYDSDKKLETGIVSVGTATTAGGTLIDGWKTTTQANAINDTTIATTAYVNNKIALIPAGLVFQGTWNAATNTPTLTSGSGTTGNFYIVSTPGNTNLDGITDWKTGDWAVFIEQGASDQWEKIDNSSVLDGFGTGGSVAGWAGSGTSNTLTNAPITFSGNNSTFAGDLYIPNKIIHVGDENTWMQFETDVISLRTGGTDRLTLTNTTATFSGDVSVEDNLYLTDGGTVRGKLILNASDRDNVELRAESLGSTMKFFTVGTEALELDASQNATFAGAVNMASGKITSDGSAAAGAYLELKHANNNTNDVCATINLTNNTGGYAAIEGGTLGANNSGYIAFKTDNAGVSAEKMRITSDGNVSLNGGLLGLGKASTTPSISYGMFHYNGVGLGVYSSASGGTQGIGFWLNNGTAAYEAGRWLSNGNVGIGTITPDSKLDVTGGDITVNTSGVGFMNFKYGSVGSESTMGSIQTTGIDLKINATSDLLLLPGSNVGIGTTSPQRNLTIYASSGNAVLQLANNNSGVGASDGFLAYTDGVNVGLENKENGYLSLATNASERMRITNAGKVGIGTTSPGQLLHVNDGSTVTTTDANNMLLLTRNNHSYIMFSCPDNKDSGLHFHNTTDNAFVGRIAYSHEGSSDHMLFTVSNSVRMDISASGAIRFNSYGAGYLKTDASGNITADNTGGGLPGGPYLPLSAGSSYPLTGLLYAGQGVKFTGGTIASATTVLHTNNVVLFSWWKWRYVLTKLRW